MFKKNEAQSIREIEKEAESRAQEAGKIFIYYALIIAIIMGIFIALNIINLDDSELFRFLGLDENPFWATIFGIFIGLLPAIPYALFGRFLTGISAHLACQSEMAAQASLALLEKFEKEEQLQSDNNMAKAPAIQLDNSSSDAGQLPQTWWHCTVCDKVNEPYCNICSKCGNVFGAKK